VVRFADGIATPESVFYDAEADRYLVSNINGSPLDADNNGYIAALSPDGGPVNKFIAGGTGKVTLNAPKGMTVSQGVLYVTDITVVRKFDLKTGAPKGDIPIAGSMFLNDLTTAPDGRIFVSDSGLKMGEKGLEPTGGDGVYVIDAKGKVKPVAKYKELGAPNGLLATNSGLYVVTFASGELYKLGDNGTRQDVMALPSGGLDGIVAVGESLLISSWQGSAVLRGPSKGPFEPVLSGLKGPADIGFDTKRQRVLVPRFMDNAVEVYELK
jgi:hypothetical protein